MKLFYSAIYLFICSIHFAQAQINPIDSPYNQDGPYTVVADSVTSLSTPILIYRPDNDVAGPYPLFLFHMGANDSGQSNITWHSYDLYLQHLTTYGYIVVVLEQVPGPPLGQFFANTLDYIEQETANPASWMSTYVDTTTVVVGGHSFGGVAASQLIYDMPERAEAIVYFASYPYLPFHTVGTYTGKMMSIAGTEDMTSDSTETRTGYDAFTSTSCKSWFYVNGLGHAGFGDYPHPEQTVGSIGRADATATLRHLLTSFMESEIKNTAQGQAQFLQASNYPNTLAEYENTCIISAVKDLDQPKLLNLKPNPASDQLQISLTKGQYQVAIVNLLGRSVFKANKSGDFNVNVSNYASGLYLITASNGEQSQTVKFVVE